MRTRHFLTGLAGSLGLLVVGACSSGAGGDSHGPTASNGYESPGATESPGGGNESPGGSGYEPTGGQEPGGGGTDPAGAAGCLPCTTYTCTVVSNGTSETATEQLTALADGSGCNLAGDATELLCGGEVATVVAGNDGGGSAFAVGSWARAGTGFTATATIGGSSGQTIVTVSCALGSAGSSGGSGNSGTPPVVLDDGGIIITFDAG